MDAIQFIFEYSKQNDYKQNDDIIPINYLKYKSQASEHKQTFTNTKWKCFYLLWWKQLWY